MVRRRFALSSRLKAARLGMNGSGSAIRQARRIGTPLLLAGAIAGYLLTFYNVDLNLADEGFFLTHALSIEKGEVTSQTVERLMMRRVGFVYYWWFQATGRNDLEVARLLWVLLRVLVGLMVLAVVRRLVPWPLAAVAAFLVAIASGPWHKTWYVFSVCAMLYLAGRPPSWRSHVWAGLVGGALFSLLPLATGIGAALPALGFLVLEQPFVHRGPWSTRSRKVVKAFAVILVSAVAGAVLLSTFNAAILVLTRDADPALIWWGPISALHQFTPGFISRMVDLGSSWTATGRLPLATLFEHHGAPSWLGWVPGVVFLLQPAVLVVALRVARSRTGQAEESRLLYLLVVLAIANLVKTSVRLDLFHVLQGAGPSYVLMIYLLWRGVVAARQRWAGLGAAKRVFMAGGLAVVSGLFPVAYVSAVIRSPSQWAASIGSRSLAERRIRLDRGRVWVGHQRATQLEEVVSRIRAWTEPSDPIFTAPFCPGLYFLSERLCVADDEVFPLGLLIVVPGLRLGGLGADQHLAHLLESRRVKAIVLCPAVSNVPQPWSALPQTRALIERQYAEAFRRDGMIILRRKPQP